MPSGMFRCKYYDFQAVEIKGNTKQVEQIEMTEAAAFCELAPADRFTNQSHVYFWLQYCKQKNRPYILAKGILKPQYEKYNKELKKESPDAIKGKTDRNKAVLHPAVYALFREVTWKEND